MSRARSQQGSRARSGTRRVVAVQLAFEPMVNLEYIREHLMAAVLEAVKKRPFLIVLPAWTGILPLHLYTGSWSFNEFETHIRRFGLALEEIWLEWSRELARQTGTYLVPGSVLVPSRRTTGILHTSVLIDPQGQVLGRVTQTHVPGADAALGMMAGTDLPVWDVEGVRVGIALGADTWYPEVGRILALQGATLMVSPTAVAAPYPPWHQLAGAWQQVQGNQIFAVEAGLCGSVAGRNLEGRTAILGPVEITPGGEGYYQRVINSKEPAVLEADLDFPRLYRLRREYPIADHFNPRLYERHFPMRYIEHASRRGAPVPVGTAGEEPGDEVFSP